MRTIFSSLVAASLLIHAMIGCCWHHGHDASCCNDAPAKQAVKTCACHHHHDGGEQHNQPSHGPCKNHCQGLCTYLPVQKSQVDSVQLHTPLDFAAIVPATCDVHVATELNTVQSHELAAGPPVRLHLFHQILLI